MKATRSIRMAGAAALALFALAACGDDNGVEPSPVVAAWTAASFTTTTSGQTRDLLDEGAQLFINLNANGSTTGTLFIPEGNTDGSDFTADLGGTWSISGNVVSFDQGADTYVRDLEFVFSNDAMVADETFGGTRIQVTLERAITLYQ